MISEEQMKADEELCAQASPAPWYAQEGTVTTDPLTYGVGASLACFCVERATYGKQRPYCNPQNLADSRFTARARTALPEYIADRREYQRRETAMLAESREIEQMLAQAIGGFPRYCDDPATFPEATKADGVCIGEHTAVTLTMAAASEIAKLRGLLERVRHGELNRFGEPRHQLWGEIAEALGK